MLESVFHKLLYMSFSAMWLAVAVLALRVLLRRAPRRVILLLWALVAVRLVCPVSVESRISVVPRPETVAQSVELPAEAAAPAVDFHAERLWLVGASAMLLWGVWGDIRLRRRVRISLPQGDNVRLCACTSFSCSEWASSYSHGAAPIRRRSSGRRCGR